MKEKAATLNWFLNPQTSQTSAPRTVIHEQMIDPHGQEDFVMYIMG